MRPKLSHQQKLLPLRQDVRFLGELLGRVLKHQEGLPLFNTEEQIRRLAIAVRRHGKAAQERQLLKRLNSC